MIEKDMPISNVEWIPVEKLNANDYNPNVVFSDEMRLLKFSLLKHGWIQPILCTQDYTIIDGFHRATIAKTNPEATCGGKVPCCIMNLSEPERMLLTIRINRAKGSHIAVKMSDIIHSLVHDFAMPMETICREIGADKSEVELLLMDNVFARKNINEETQYSKAWYPKRMKD